MSVPVPAPRSSSSDLKKPIPLPRRTKKPQTMPPIILSTTPTDENSVNSLSRRVRSLSNASKQIAEDIGEMVIDRKKAVIEGTRQSVRRITKRFNSTPPSCQQHPEETSSQQHFTSNREDIDVFNSIRFDSPIHYSSSIYNNVSEENEEDEYSSLPPPSHPPPPLPDDSIYDAPASTSGSSNSSVSVSLNNNKLLEQEQNYESVFPRVFSNADGSDSDLSRSGSWKFYDSVAGAVPIKNAENVYNDVEEKDEEEEDGGASDISSVQVRNSIYENHRIGNSREIRGRATESVIIQFDPLKSRTSKHSFSSDSNAENIKMLEDFFDKDLYSNMSSIYTLDSWSISNDSEEEFTAPPPPPLRFDSLPEDEQPSSIPAPAPASSQSQPTTPSTTSKSKTNWFTSQFDSTSANKAPTTPPEASSSNKKLNWLRQVKGVLEKAPDIVKGSRSKDAVVQRPQLECKSFIHKKGMLYKVQSGPVEDLFGEYSGRWCILQNSEFVCYADSTSETVKERFPAETVLSIQIIQDPKFKYKYENEELHCFELNTTGKSRGGHIYGARDLPERRIWMQYICESLCKKFVTKLTSNYTRMGWCYLREGVSSKWMGAWIMLSKRKLYYALDAQPLKSIDLRKARCISFQIYQEADNNPRTNDRGPNLVLDSTELTLYLRMWTARETKVWCHLVKLAAHNNGASIEEQQLTKNNIPVLVEKCINFIYTHGSMSEGIYRKPGTGKFVTDILVKFRKNAWEVQLTKDDYSEYDVGTALKRFFRDLPEPLLTTSRRQYFHRVSLLNDESEQIRMYKAALEELPPIVYKTAKKLIGHLHFVASQHEKNLMNVDNLASLWGITLMTSEQELSNSPSKHVNDAVVVSHLIKLYKHIFPEDAAEVEQEKLMLKFLQKYAQSPQGSVNNSSSAGDFRVWIYLNNREGESVNVAVGATKTAYEVCAELSEKIKMPVHQVILEEVVLSNKLTRPIHHTEKVLDIVLRWGYWDEADRKDNHLVLLPVVKYSQLIGARSDLHWDDFKFADAKTRHFKSYAFRIAQAKLCYYKDKSCESLLGSWNVEDLVWYFGNEAKRTSPTRFSVTFLETQFHPNRTKGAPYFGNIVACASERDRVCLLKGLISAVYVDGLVQPAMHVNLLN